MGISWLKQKWRTYPRLLWLVGLTAFLNVISLSFIWPMTTLYIHAELGRDLTTAGIILFLHSGAASLGNLAGGWIFDRFGARPVMLTGMFGSALLIALPGLVASWPLYVAVMLLFGFALGLPGPAMSALVARAWPEGGREAFNFLYVSINAGVAAGTALGSVIAGHSFTLAFLTSAAIAIVTGGIVYWFVRDPGDAHPARPVAAESVQSSSRIPWLPVVALLTGQFVGWVVYVQWQGPVPVQMETLGISVTQYGQLWTMNGVLIVAGQPLLSLLLRRLRSLSGQLIVGTLLFTGSFALLLTARHYAGFAVGMAVLSLGEMLVWPGVPAAVDELAPTHRRGFLQGMVSSVTSAGRMCGPLLGGLVFDHLGFSSVALGGIGLLLVPLGAFVLYARTQKAKGKTQALRASHPENGRPVA